MVGARCRPASTVEVRGASIALPFLRDARAATQPGGPAEKLTAYRDEAPFEVSDATLNASRTWFRLPPPQR